MSMEMKMKPSAQILDAPEIIKDALNGGGKGWGKKIPRHIRDEIIQLVMDMRDTNVPRTDKILCEMICDIKCDWDTSTLSIYNKDGWTPPLIDFYGETPTHSRKFEISSYSHKSAEQKDKRTQDEFHRKAIETIQKYHSIKHIRQNIKEFDTNRMTNRHLIAKKKFMDERSKASASGCAELPLASMTMDLHVWCVDAENNVVFDCGQKCPAVQFDKWRSDYVEGTEVYVPFSARNQSEKWAYLQTRMNAEITEGKEKLRKYHKTPISSMCYLNAAAYKNDARKRGVKVSIRIGSYGWRCKNGDWFWKWGDGGDGSSVTNRFDTTNWRLTDVSEDDKIANVIECVVDELPEGCIHMEARAFLKKHWDTIERKLRKQKVEGDTETLIDKVWNSLENGRIGSVY